MHVFFSFFPFLQWNFLLSSPPLPSYPDTDPFPSLFFPFFSLQVRDWNPISSPMNQATKQRTNQQNHSVESPISDLSNQASICELITSFFPFTSFLLRYQYYPTGFPSHEMMPYDTSTHGYYSLGSTRNGVFHHVVCNNRDTVGNFQLVRKSGKS